MPLDPFHALQDFEFTAEGKASRGRYYALPALEAAGLGKISRLPVSLRVVLESVLRNCDGKKVTEAHVKRLAAWQPNAARTDEIPFIVARVVLQDFTGVPLLADLAAMRGVAARLGKDPKRIEPLVPVDLVVDHSVQIDHYGSADALDLNMQLEFQRNAERYRFIKWGMQAFDTFKVVPPGMGIVHQINLEYLARGVHGRDGVYYPDTLVGTDSHTTMINGIGSVGWGVGGIEAEAGMLGQPVYFLTPDVVGVNLSGKLNPGVTATDLVLTVTELLRRAKVVGKFVEFHGEGAASLSLPDRATIANMAPEYGATMGFFAVDDKTVAYLAQTGRSPADVAAFEAYYRAQGLFGTPAAGSIDYSGVIELDLGSVAPSVAGPKRPQDRIPLEQMKARFTELFSRPVADNGYNKPAQELRRRHLVHADFPQNRPISGGGKQGADAVRGATPADIVEMVDNRPTPDRVYEKLEDLPPGAHHLGHGDVLIAAITSCTNTSNPGVLLAAGLLAKKAAARGLKVQPHIKTSLAPGSRVVTGYLKAAGLMKGFEALGFHVAGYGCTTCIGNAGPLDPRVEETVVGNDLICAAVLSGNRNFEARIHSHIKANFLASPPLVVAYAIAGTVLRDLATEPLGTGGDGKPVFLRDVWPSNEEVAAAMSHAADPKLFRSVYGDLTRDNPLWQDIASSTGQTYAWADSTYIAEPPFFGGFDKPLGTAADLLEASILGIFGDSVTTDHISPAGAIKPVSPAGKWLQERGVQVQDFNSYGARRGNHEIMMRGTFANVRIKNLMLPPKLDGARVEGGLTLLQPDGQEMSIYDAAMEYQKRGVPTVILAGEEYGTGSSRDWAAKGPQLLGVKAVVAKSFERIHRSNLVGMGILPCQFLEGTDAATLGLDGTESVDITGLEGGIKPQMALKLTARRRDGSTVEAPLLLRIDTPIEVDYYLNGGILPYVLRGLLAA